MACSRKSRLASNFPMVVKVFEKNINDNPEDFFTDEIMGKLENAVAKEFKYGSAVEEDEPETLGVEEDV